jgi:hypothetical protein
VTTMGFRSTWVLASFIALSACASTIPAAELNRCNIGLADGNDAFAVRQGAACRMVAQRLTSNDRPAFALGYARKACALEYLALVRGQPSLLAYELPPARAAGEKACAGLIIADNGAEALASICARTAELYLDLEPRSRVDADRLYARACKLGDRVSCARAAKVGGSDGPPKDAKDAKGAEGSPELPPAASSPPALAPSAPARACHPMRTCVALDVREHKATEVVGSARNHCERAVVCMFCPARGELVDKKACRSITLAPDESKAGREAGLWYEGFTAIAYDCVDATDDRACLGM